MTRASGAMGDKAAQKAVLDAQREQARAKMAAQKAGCDATLGRSAQKKRGGQRDAVFSKERWPAPFPNNNC